MNAPAPSAALATPEATLWAGNGGAALNGAALLAHLGVIRATGADAASFLQGQLTQDVLTMAVGESRLAAFCSAKGRMQATFQVAKRLDANGVPEFLLVCSRDILTATCKRLSMFVLRAKAKLVDASGEFSVFGLLGDAIQNIAENVHNTKAGGSSALRIVMRLPGNASLQRALCLTPIAAGTPAGTVLEEATWPRAEEGIWLWAEVQSGIARITLPTVDAFVPQMLNYESLQGVNFKKGCYPGQEVVARSQFRGTLKRRAYLVHSSVPLAVGDEVYGPADADQACGSVALAAKTPGAETSGFDAIVAIQVAAAQAGGLRLGSATGPALAMLALPYALLDDL